MKAREVTEEGSCRSFGGETFGGETFVGETVSVVDGVTGGMGDALATVHCELHCIDAAVVVLLVVVGCSGSSPDKSKEVIPNRRA